MFTGNIDAHNLIVELLNEPVNNKKVLSWIFRNKNFLCLTYSTIKKIVLKELHELNKCHHGKIVTRKEGIEEVFKYFEDLLHLSIVVRKFNNIKQAVGFINLLILEYYANGIKDEAELVKFKSMVLLIYNKILSDLRKVKANTRCGYLLEKVLEHLTGNSDFDLLREIARMEGEHGALKSLLRKDEEMIQEFMPSIRKDGGYIEELTRKNIICCFSLEEPITCPVYLPNDKKKQCYSFESLERYINIKLEEIKKKKNKMTTCYIKHPYETNQPLPQYKFTPSQVCMSWSHVKPEIQAVCYDNLNKTYSLKKLHSLVLEQVDKKNYDFRKEKILRTEDDEARSFLLSI